MCSILSLSGMWQPYLRAWRVCSLHYVYTQPGTPHSCHPHQAFLVTMKVMHYLQIGLCTVSSILSHSTLPFPFPSLIFTKPHSKSIWYWFLKYFII